MTEMEWLTCTDPQPMVEFVAGRGYTRLQDLASACCLHAGTFIDGTLCRPRPHRLVSLIDDLAVPCLPADDIETNSSVIRPETLALMALSTIPRAKGTAIVRCVLGNPFYPVAVDPAWLAWNGGTVQHLAAAICADHAFDRLPILADALEDAGCHDAEILAHCRGGGEHVRGCWVLYLLTGRE